MYLEKPPLLSGGGTLVFVNDCPYERFLNVCTVDERGEPKLHESARRIPGYGSMRIFVQSGRRLEAVIYSSDRYEPGIPHPCLGL